MDYTYNAESFRQMFEQNFTWAAGFMRSVHRYGRRAAMHDPIRGRSWTYDELNRDVNRFANALAGAGVRNGDMVMYQLYNSPQFVYCYIAPQKLGAVNSPVNFNISAGETARLIDRDRPKVYVYDCDVREMAERALELCSFRPEIVLAVDYRGTSPQLAAGHRFFEEFTAGASEQEPVCDFLPDMYAETTRLCTSGTTGTPKGVPLNSVNEILSAHDTIMHFPLTPMDVTMNMTPWFHRGGLHSGGITPTFYVGASLVILRMFSPGICFECAERYGVTFLIGVPSALAKLAARQEKHPADLSSLKGIVTMGSPLGREECERYQSVLTPNIFNGYGTTETFWNSFLRPFDLPEMAGSAGRPCTDDEVRVVNMYDNRKAEPDDTVPADGKTPGEIIIFSAGKSSLCYAHNEELTAEKYYKGWYYSKDIGTWDEERFITVSGRRDDMIVCMGENIFPEQLESVISSHPGVRDCMVTGVPDASRGQAVVAYIIPETSELTVREINSFCVSSDDMPGYMCPRYYVFTDKLPYTATGKRQHTLLRAKALEDMEEGRLLRP